MEQTTAYSATGSGSSGMSLGRIGIGLVGLAVTLVFLVVGFVFLRDSDAPRLLIAVVAIVWGVGGVAALFTVANYLVE